MASKTVTYPVCDGASCEKILDGANDGIVIHGYIMPTGVQKKETAPLVGSQSNTVMGKPTVVTYCWACFHKLVSDSVLAKAKREVKSAQEESRRSSGSSSGSGSGYDNNDYDPYPRTGPKGPTGPMSPPDLPQANHPHYVEVMQSIAGVPKP